MSVDPRDLARTLNSDVRRRAVELDALLDLVPIGIAIAEDPDCRRFRVNRTLARHLGITPGQHVSLSSDENDRPNFRILATGAENQPSELPMRRAVETGMEVRDIDLDIVQPDGKRTTLSAYAAPMLDDAGVACGAVGIFIDVTERRREEQDQRFLADAGRVLASSLECEATLAALARLAVPRLGDYCSVDVMREDGTLARVEMVVRDPARREIGQALRSHPPALTLDGPAAWVIGSGEPIMANECPPSLLARAAQSPEHVELLRRFGVCGYIMVPIRARGRTLGLLTAGTFDSSRRYTECDLELATEVASRAGIALDNGLLYRHAQEANRLKEDFLATLSHELRTPLNALLGWTHMLRSAALDDAARLRALESVERNAHAQAVLINDLLDVSRVVSGKLRLEEQPVDLPAVVLAAVDAVRPAVRARDIDLGVALAPVSGEVVGDPDRLQQVVWNLLSNAVKFTPPHGRVDLSVEQIGGAVQIAVSDTGVGIDPAFLPYVFERFRQADSSITRTHGGLGLGLSIVRNLVDLHGGTVTVESTGIGQGSRFVVTLPVRRTPSRPSDGYSRDQSDAMTLQGVRVLAVDDDQDSRELLLLILRAAGAEVMVVGSAASALDALGGFNPHVIVTDIAMPDMDGHALMREIAARSAEGVGPRGIALTAYATPGDVKRAMEAGFALHVGKPADYDRLIRAIANLARVSDPV